MVYIKGIFILMMTFIVIELSSGTKFAYKKPIYGKANNAIKEKRFKIKSDANVVRPVPESTIESITYPGSTTTTTTTTTSTTTSTTTPAPPSSSSTSSFSSLENTRTPESLEVEENTNNDSTLSDETISTTPLSTITTTTIPSSSEQQASIEAAETTVLDMPYISLANENTLFEESTTSEAISTPIVTALAPPTEQPVDIPAPKAILPLPAPPPPPSNQPVACTCGVFLSSQIHRGMTEQPLILNELDRMYPCNAIGRKQCQTKCLEAIVQHLPNSANIVCATLGEDCHKERAYLFIKNCQNQWWNTNLQAGREYCCKSGQPYRCPLI